MIGVTAISKTTCQGVRKKKQYAQINQRRSIITMWFPNTCTENIWSQFVNGDFMLILLFAVNVDFDESIWNWLLRQTFLLRWLLINMYVCMMHLCMIVCIYVFFEHWEKLTSCIFPHIKIGFIIKKVVKFYSAFIKNECWFLSFKNKINFFQFCKFECLLIWTVAELALFLYTI